MHREVIGECEPLLHLIAGQLIARYDYVSNYLIINIYLLVNLIGYYSS
jgi:hypothetical protein